MRVAYTIEQCWHRVPGGTARAALEVARSLLAPDGPGAPGSADTLGSVELVGVAARHGADPPAAWTPPMPVRQLPLPRLALYEAWHLARRPAVQHATGPVDVIHATGVAVPPKSAPLVVTVHDLAYVRDPGQFTRKGRRFFEQALRLTRRDADVVLCSSEATRRDCIDAGFDPLRLRVVPLGVRAERVGEGDVAATVARYGLRRPYVLSVGTHEPRKNLPALIEAFRRLGRDDLDLVLVGPAGWHVDLDAAVAPIAERVRVLGFVPAVDRDALYGGAAVFCYPSTFEGFGLPVLEAMAQGTPVVTSAGTATEEAAGDAGIVVDPHDPAAIAAGLATVLDDEVLAARLRADGVARAAAFTWDRTAALTLEAYRSVLA